MSSVQNQQERDRSLIHQLKSLFRTPDLSEYSSYEAWQHRFVFQRLTLGFGLAILAYLTFILLQFNSFLFNLAEFRPTWLITQIIVELCLFMGLGLLQTSWGQQYLGVMFLLLSWVVNLSPQIRLNLSGLAEAAIIEWPLMFFSQATLIPVRWQFHLISQLGVLFYYLGSQHLFNLTIKRPAAWMSEDFLLLYLFWIGFISCLSVYLYERLARTEFRTRHALNEAYKQLQVEQQRSENLLLNILPFPIVQRLKKQPTTIADSFTNAAVLFGDIVGFTELSGQIPPAELVQMLNQIFSEFDHLADQHGLEKIKTIGDAYMVVSGLPVPCHDYAEAIADMALDMRLTLDEFNQETGQHFQMRIGIATGPVIAGVIGLKKFIYDLWGDTVNIASRMESHGIANEIQVTEKTYNILRHEYSFQQRGLITIKGKGEMMTYLLKSKK
ncbi:MAG: adenylate/guanylate cyclase domain-containing protein [Microcoleaceae cyanobacterium]